MVIRSLLSNSNIIQKKGFTLIELSIVIAIIGLLMSGVLLGIDIMKSAELRAVTSEVETYKSALGQFEYKYEGLPGDINNASTFWSTAVNGDSDGLIDAETILPGVTKGEAFDALEQLIFAGFVEGTTTGDWTGAYIISSPGVTGNIPQSQGKKNAGMLVSCCPSQDYTGRVLSLKNYIAVIGALSGYRLPIFTPVEAASVDAKIDDGNPDYGFVGAGSNYSGGTYVGTGCYTNTGTSATYNTAISPDKNLEKCYMIFGYDWDL